MPIETSRLMIRDVEMNDWPAVHRYGSDLEIMKYAIYHANNETDTKNFVQQAMTSAKQVSKTIYERAVLLRKMVQDGESINETSRPHTSLQRLSSRLPMLFSVGKERRSGLPRASIRRWLPMITGRHGHWDPIHIQPVR